MKRQYWYTLLYKSELSGEKDWQVVGFEKAVLFRIKKDALKKFEIYPKYQKTRGFKEWWSVKRVLL